MVDYESICQIATQCGFKDFTALQNRSFKDENFYSFKKWLFIIGATGSGKTLIALLSYFYEQRLHSQKGLPYKMLFSVPYRALASQKIDEIIYACRMLGLDLKILQSTSENTRDDNDIICGNADIAIIINEKIFMFAASDAKFLSRYNLLVLDEFALTQDPIRGIKTDFVLLKARREPNLRVVTLATPFFDWRNYINNFDFHIIHETQRPIEIKEIPIFKPYLNIDALPKQDFFIDICKKHLLQNEKIIIFLNSRQEVQKLSRTLTQKLADCGALEQWSKVEQCKKYILNESQAFDETSLYGILEAEDYKSLSYGIAFHNANMPPSLRYFIERDFMNTNGYIKIVCSTETLAYGINSNADVVIIPGMLKNNYGFSSYGKIILEHRIISPNEYMNYAGRAGRLDPLLPLSEQKKFGYVYPIMKKQLLKSWDNLARQIKTPELSISGYFKSESDVQALFLLSLFSEENVLTASDIADLVKELPHYDEQVFDAIEFIEKPLQYLLRRRLIYIVNADYDSEEYFVAEYKATDVGKKISGFVIKLADFDKILADLCHYTDKEHFFETDLFNSILSTEGIFVNLKIICGELTDKGKNFDSPFLPKTISEMEKIFKKNRRQMTTELYNQLLKNINSYKSAFKAKKYDKVFNDKNFILNRILAAILMWRYGECTPRSLYNSFKIYYEQMRRLMEIISYRLDMIRFSLNIAPGKNPSSTLLKEIGKPSLIKLEERLSKICTDIMYQPSSELCDLLNIRHCDMYTIQKLKPIDSYYHKLIKFSSNEEIPQDYKQKIIGKMQSWPSAWREAFVKKFGGILYA